MRTIAILLLTACILYSCTSDKKQESSNSETKETFKLFEELSSEKTGLKFKNVVNETPESNITIYDYYYNGSGVAVIDINNDGLDDLFFTGNNAKNKLYLNEGGLSFKDISASAGIETNKWATGASVVDINQDGFLDIYVCNSGPFNGNQMLNNDLFINNGDNTFTESLIKYGLEDGARSVQAGFADFDKDGDLDLWLNNHLRRRIGGQVHVFFDNLENTVYEENKQRMKNMYFENVDGKFVNKSEEKEVNEFAFSLGLAIADLNDDGWLDVYCANDYFLPDFYYVNDHKGGFKKVTNALMDHNSFYSMGVDANDFNNDGLLDVAVVDMTPSDHVRNKVLMESMDVRRFRYLHEVKKYPKQYMFNGFYLNRGQGKLSDIAHQLKIAQTDWSWTSLLVDLDQDGFKDYFVTNGFLRDTKNNDYGIKMQKLEQEKGRQLTPAEVFEHMQKVPSQPLNNYLFKNIKGEQLSDVSDTWGIKTPTFSNGAAYGDFDNDGDLDLVINNLSQEVTFMENLSNGRNNHVSIKLSDKNNPASVMHAKLTIKSGQLTQRFDYSFVRGYQSCMADRIVVGIGKNKMVDELVIEYLDGSKQIEKNLAINTLHNIERKTNLPIAAAKERPAPVIIELTSRIPSFNFKHNEDSFDDFEKEVLLPHKYSNLGPCLAVGDVNGDGFDDFYLGGSNGYPGKIITQSGNQFVELENETFSFDKQYEDLGAQFVDIDNDKDLDLYVASGGGGDVKFESLLQDRLYINDGKGIFTVASKKLPRITSSTAAIAAHDFNGDGLQDLFVGGRNVPGEYPLKAKSYLLINNNGNFEDKISDYFNEEELPGMITSALSEDFNGDKAQDLFLVSEWDEPKLFTNNKNKFTKVSSSFDNYKGWWMNAKAADLDKDGDLDLVLGNLGENNKFHPSFKKPLGVLASDFDDNGTHDVVLTKTYKDRIVPTRGKECSTEQMPFLQEKFSSYSDFANSSVQEILGAESIKDAEEFSVTTFSSYVALNDGKGNFTINRLPFAAQMSPMKGIAIQDYNADGHLDIFAAGSIKETEPETTSYDAGCGVLMKGDGKGNFVANQSFESVGVLLRGNVSGLANITLGSGQKGILVGNNNEATQLLLATK